MTRFSIRHKSPRPAGLLISACIFGLLLSGFLIAINGFSANTRTRQRETLENALQRSILYCYTLEGRYPESLEYLKDHYGLVYNEELFFVDYRTYGTNILPDVTILEKNNQRDK